MSWAVSKTAPIGVGDRKRRRTDEPGDEVPSEEESGTADGSESEPDEDFVVPDDEAEPERQFYEYTGLEIILSGPAVLGSGKIELRRSQIPRAGSGLYATEGFAAGEPITMYYGELITRQTASARLAAGEASHIVPLISFRFYIDGLRHPNGAPITGPRLELVGRGLGAYVNSTRGTELVPNARFDYADFPPNERVMRAGIFDANRLDPNQRLKYIRAITDIGAGEEILVDYGLIGMVE